MTDKQELYTILKVYEELQIEISSFPDWTERPGLTDEEYDALAENYDDVIRKTERHLFELLDSALRRAEKDDDFWNFDNRGSL